MWLAHLACDSRAGRPCHFSKLLSWLSEDQAADRFPLYWRELGANPCYYSRGFAGIPHPPLCARHGDYH